MIHRARFGFGKGPHSITFNFFRSLKSEMDRHSPDKVYIVSEGKPRHRIIENPEYKGNRIAIKDDGFHRQKADIFELCKFLPVTVTRHPDYECDDVIGFLATKAHVEDVVTICSSDSDFIQLIEESRVSLWNPVKKRFIERWPVDYVTWKSLKGDATDNVPGIRGVGSKRAYTLAADTDMLEKFLSEDLESRMRVFESAKRQIKLADIVPEDRDWIIDEYNFHEEKLKNAFTFREFKTIISKSWPKWQKTMEKLNND
jgi:5'-3' exonuclease